VTGLVDDEMDPAFEQNEALISLDQGRLLKQWRKTKKKYAHVADVQAIREI
jgi:hypothetical protein